MTSSSDTSGLARFGAVGESLLRTVAGGRLSPSYLFEGADSEVLEEAGRAFATAVLEAGSNEAARPRVRALVARDAHPDLHVRRKDKATVISVAALAETLEQAHATPVAGRHQVFLIQPAEAMEPEGVARYLNALEEPPEGTVFLLLSTRPDRLPNAVLSRVRRIRLPPLAEGFVARRLEADGETRGRGPDLGTLRRGFADPCAPDGDSGCTERDRGLAGHGARRCTGRVGRRGTHDGDPHPGRSRDRGGGSRRREGEA